MPDEQEKNQAAPRFRLPKLFAQGPEAAAAEGTLPEVEIAQSEATTDATEAPVKASTAASNGSRHSASGAALDSASEMAAMRQAIENLSEQVSQVNERETALERVFDTLHAELADYKNDFLYEHLKPVVRPLLFLFDSLEQFDSEVAMAQATTTQTATESVLSASAVQGNLRFFRDQLIEALQVCEVTIMETPQGAFNAKFHKAIDVVPVAAPDDGTIVRVVRSGWFLNGQLLRPAEVVIGKFRG